MTRIMEISRLSGYVIECNCEESEGDEASARESDIDTQWEKKVREKDTERAFPSSHLCSMGGVRSERGHAGFGFLSLNVERKH